MTTLLGIIGIVVCVILPVILILGVAYEMGYSKGRSEGIAEFTTKINEGKVQFTYVDIVPRTTPRSK